MPSRQFRHLQNQHWGEGSQARQRMLVIIQLNTSSNARHSTKWSRQIILVSFLRKQSAPLARLLLVKVNDPADRMTIPFGDYQPSDEASSQLFTPRLRLWLDERLRHLASQQKIQDARALRSEFSIEERSTRWHFIRFTPSDSNKTSIKISTARTIKQLNIPAFSLFLRALVLNKWHLNDLSARP